jgi:hypothetical protein
MLYPLAALAAVFIGVTGIKRGLNLPLYVDADREFWTGLGFGFGVILTVYGGLALIFFLATGP